MTTQTDTAPLSARLRKNAIERTGGLPDETAEWEAADALDALSARVAELTSLQAALSASQAREAGMRAVLRLAAQWGISADGYHAFIATGLKRWIADGATGPLPDEVMDAARRNCHSELVAALSPAQPAQGADIARELAGALSECRPLMEFAPERFYPRIERADDVLAQARSAGLLTTETTEGGNG